MTTSHLSVSDRSTLDLISEVRHALAPEERASLIARLETYNDQLAEATTQLDYGSLDRAADLAALYEDRAWVEELEPPKTHDKRGHDIHSVFCRSRQPTAPLTAGIAGRRPPT